MGQLSRPPRMETRCINMVGLKRGRTGLCGCRLKREPETINGSLCESERSVFLITTISASGGRVDDVARGVGDEVVTLSTWCWKEKNP